jgi:hypothetical protein
MQSVFSAKENPRPEAQIFDENARLRQNTVNGGFRTARSDRRKGRGKPGHHAPAQFD